MNYLARIEQYHPDIVEDFLQKKTSSAIPKDLQILIVQLSFAVEIWEKQRNVKRAARLLKARIHSAQGITLGLMACQQRINDSKIYFHVDMNVSNKYWLLDAADQFEDLAKAALVLHKVTEAGRFTEKAVEYRLRANAEISLADMAPPMFLLSNKMKLEDLGFEKKQLREIARKDSDGFYIKLITSLPIDRKNKKQLLYDANIEDAKILDEIENDGPE
jgi:hypothetical protein